MSVRDGIRALSPPWLRDGDAEKFEYVFGLAADCLIEKQNQATLAHMPGLGTETALPFLGDDRLIVQGPAESNAQYTARLRGALDAWSEAGSRAAVLAQVQAFLGGTQPGLVGMLPEVLIVGGNSSISTWDVLYRNAAQGDSPTHILRSPANWNWDGVTTKPKRSWLILFFALVPTGLHGVNGILSAGPTGFFTLTEATLAAQVGDWITISGSGISSDNGTFPVVAVTGTSATFANPAGDTPTGALTWSLGRYPFVGPGPVWDAPGATWDDPARSWGLQCRSQLVDSIRALVKRWKCADNYVPRIIFAFDGAGGGPGAMFSPYSAAGAGNPDGAWGAAGKNVGGVMVNARVTQNPFDDFADGTGTYDQCAVHNVT